MNGQIDQSTTVSPVPPPIAHILSLDEEDLPAVQRIEQAAHIFPWSERVFKDCMRSGYYLDGAYDRSTLLGFSVVMPILNEWHLLNLCVDPKRQRRGVGRLLLEYMIEQAKKAEVDSLWLEVREGNAGAKQLYSAYGFEQVGLRKAYYPAKQGREDALVLTRTLE
ncbi:ribosomal protein S18-alanine N-acetyltransferase [Halothiobacillus sp.]|uniref:ribosomal protein S18-alanine N-acetyltransferase n=1 Tax=Halothiobacillus sp. TaxID=1891311 RepID=UPI0026054D8A|nr:ribosomal protein S18-alanine N-acetyltransferase [Halothiobacillus sp.]